MSQPTVTNRVERLRETGIIKGFTLDLDRSILPAAATFRPLVPVLTLNIVIVVTGGFYLAGSVTGWSALHHPMYLLLIFGQMWDAAQSLVGVILFGYTPKMFLTQQLYQLTGFEGSTFAVKLLAVIFIVWILADGEKDPRENSGG